MITWLKGKKTYIVSALTVIYAVLAVYFHQMTVVQALGFVLGGSGLAALRAGIAKLNQTVNQ